MIKFLFKFLFSRLTYSQLVELIYSNPVVLAYFTNKQLNSEKELITKHSSELDTLRTKIKLLESELVVQNTYAQIPPPPVQQVQLTTRLTQEVYDYIEKSCGCNTLVSSTTSDIEAGYKLGVQHVLSKLRVGYVISQS